MIDRRVRYLQLAFNDDLQAAMQIVARLPREDRILVEAGTPLILGEGLHAVKALRERFPDHPITRARFTSDCARPGPSRWARTLSSTASSDAPSHPGAIRTTDRFASSPSSASASIRCPSMVG